MNEEQNEEQNDEEPIEGEPFDEEEQIEENGDQQEDLPNEAAIWNSLRLNFTAAWLDDNPQAIDMARHLHTLYEEVVLEGEPPRKQPRVDTSTLQEAVARFGFDLSVVGRVVKAIFPLCENRQFTVGGHPHNSYICLRPRENRSQ